MVGLRTTRPVRHATHDLSLDAHQCLGEGLAETT